MPWNTMMATARGRMGERSQDHLCDVDHFYYSRFWPSSLTSVTMRNNVLVKINYIGHGVAFSRKHSSASA